MSQHELHVVSRTDTGKEISKRLRRDGLVPAVAYGHKEEPVKLAVNAKELRDLLAHRASHGLLTLKYKDGSASDVSVVIKALDRHPYKPSVNSVDFLRVSLDEQISATVPVVLTGEAIGVKQDGGVLVQTLHQVEISALPQNLPQDIKVDVSGLELDGHPIHLRDVTLPTGVVAVTDGESPIAVVNRPRVAEPEPAAVAAEGAAPAADATAAPAAAA